MRRVVIGGLERDEEVKREGIDKRMGGEGADRWGTERGWGVRE